jgi:hypothetical protein
MAEKKSNQNVGAYVEFPEGISVRVIRTDVEIVRKPYGEAPDTKDFRVIRRLVNFAIRDKNADPPGDFESEVELLVRFTKDMLDEAKAVAEAEEDPNRILVFAYYVKGQNIWVKHYPDNVNVIRHEYSADFPRFDGFGGYDVIKLKDWPADPGGAWGV